MEEFLSSEPQTDLFFWAEKDSSLDRMRMSN
jgi:hypothetical protein